MSVNRLIVLLIVLSALWGQSRCVGQEAAGAGVNNNLEAGLTRQLKINKAALLHGPGEQVRVDAALELLLSQELAARKILLQSLRQRENAAARLAVCKALGQSRSWQKSIRDKKDFIQPLLGILKSKKGNEVKLAAEALLIFEYKKVSKQLKRIIADPEGQADAKLNAIYALKLRPDKEAISELIRLLDNTDKEIAAAAAKALQDWFPVGTDKEVWGEILKDLRKKSPAEIVKDRLVRQEAKAHRLQAELQLWQKLYLSALDKMYDSSADEQRRSLFLMEYLASDHTAVRLWALDKIFQWRLSGRPIPSDFGPGLAKLIPDRSRDVRLKTSKLLARMGNLNLAKQLLEQLKVESDDEVRTELFGALGEACYYAFSPGSNISIPREIRKQALELAGGYIAQQDPRKTQKGAEVVRKLLQQDGFNISDVKKYLALLAHKYKQQEQSDNGMLGGELLNVMAGLCSQNVYGDYRAEASRLFEDIFIDALGEETNLVREAAVTGLVNMDEVRAFSILVEKGLINDSSSTIRNSLIELAERIGGEDELVWLAEQINSNGQGSAAWTAMLKIFQRSEVAVIWQWISKFEDESAGSKLTFERKIHLLRIAEEKASSENKPDVLKSVRRRLADLYSQKGEFESAAKYWGMLVEGTEEAEDKKVFLTELLDVYLRGAKLELAGLLIANRLSEKDLNPNGLFVARIGKFLNSREAGTDAAEFLAELAKIRVPQERPNWQKQLHHWQEQFGAGAVEVVPEPNRMSR